MFFVSSYTSLSDFILQWRMLYVQQLAHKYSHAATAFLHFSILQGCPLFPYVLYQLKGISPILLALSDSASIACNYAKHPQLCTPKLVRPKKSFDFIPNTKCKLFLNQMLFQIEHMLWREKYHQILRRAEVTLQKVASMPNASQC